MTLGNINEQRLYRWQTLRYLQTGVFSNVQAHALQITNGIDWSNRTPSPKFERGKINTTIEGFLPIKKRRQSSEE